MYFNSVNFFIFFAVVYALYLLVEHRWQNRILLLASYFFYGCWDWRFLSLLCISTLLDYGCGLKIHEAKQGKARKRFLWLSIAGNLVLLGYFKYFGFFSESLSVFLDFMGFQVNPWSLRVLLPVGISFYTFQTMSYTIDIYRGNLKPTRSFLNFALFVSFFPQLVAGPIERAKRLLPQIEAKRTLNLRQLREGVFLIAWGLFKKVIIADNLGRIATHNLGHYEAVGCWGIFLGLYAFAGQLYGDFSGYSDIARGLAKMMGFELMVNFRLPYFAVRPSDFWGRWHISLTSWVRDYFFFSIGSARDSRLRMAWNNILTMTLIGLWHGAAWTFVLWGFAFGLLQAGHGLLRPWLKRTIRPQTARAKLAVKLVSMFLMFHAFFLSGYLFRAENLQHTVGLLTQSVQMVVPTAAHLHMTLAVLFFYAPLLIMQVGQYRTKDLLCLLKQTRTVQFVAYSAAALMVVAVYLFGASVKGGEEFIYFQF